jgi:hypothetical protein
MRFLKKTLETNYPKVPYSKEFLSSMSTYPPPQAIGVPVSQMQMQQPVYSNQPQMTQTMTVTVPAGLGPGTSFAINTVSGPMQVTVPFGIVPTAAGTLVMQVQVPVAPQPVVQPVVQAPTPQVMTPEVQLQPEQPRGAKGLIIYEVNLSTCGDDCSGCCDASASPVQQLIKSNKKTTPEKLKGTMSDAAWELILEKLSAWQGEVGPFPVPSCEAWCWCTCCCGCGCLPCLGMQYAARSAWETTTAREINEMLSRYHVELAFEKRGTTPLSSYAKFTWA